MNLYQIGLYYADTPLSGDVECRYAEYGSLFVTIIVSIA